MKSPYSCNLQAYHVQPTSLSDTREGIRKICGDRVADGCKQLWGLNAEGEINGCWRDLGFPGLWYMMGLFFSSLLFI